MIATVKSFWVSLPSATLREALTFLRPLVKGKVRLPVLAMARVTYRNGAVTLEATDLDHGAAFTVPNPDPPPADESLRRRLAAHWAARNGSLCVPMATLVMAARDADPGTPVRIDGRRHSGEVQIVSGGLMRSSAFEGCRAAAC